jgi:glycosyltransferase involved in cell wall biosynthesis
MSAFTPRFSVIIPNFNHAATLSQAIDSVLAQSYPAHEIIVIDDGSTDDSRLLLERYAGRIRAIYQDNAGVSAARNRAVESAEGDWLAFLDADDVFLPDRLKQHADWIREEPDLDFLLAEQESRTPDGRLLNRFLAESSAGRLLIAENPDQQRMRMTPRHFEALVADGFGEIRTLSLPRAKFLEVGGFPEDCQIGEDLHFFIRLYAASSKAGAVRQVLATYLIHEGSTLRRNPVRTMELFVETLDSLAPAIRSAPMPIRKGYVEKCRHTRLSLAYAYLRAGRRADAIRGVLPSLMKQPGLRTLRDVLSVCRGFPGQAAQGR